MTSAHDPAKPLILAIETSTLTARVAVVDTRTGAAVAAAEAEAARHSSNLLRLCIDVTERAAVAVPALGAVACGAGPGSFTGLRVGMAVGKGLAMPTATPFLVVSSLEALALDMLPHASDADVLLPAIDAGKGQVFVAPFQRSGNGAGVSRLGDDCGALPEAVGPRVPDGGSVVIAGPGAARYREVLLAALGSRARFAEVAGPTALSVARLAIGRLARGETDDLASSVPSYGRAPDITRPKRRPDPSP
jgi:tRNA threonylcarbamoyladenosine biosynthesis protein TsaB